MKKKLLSLVLAGAMVASTSVSAFAATTENKVINSYDDGKNSANVTIEGSVDSDSGQQAAGTISVSIPTALQFRVDRDGNVNGAGIDVVNNGLDEVEVIAAQFIDDTPNRGITVKSPSDFSRSDRDSKSRKDVVLWIEGNNRGERAYFNPSEENGICNENGENKTEGIVVSTLSKKNDGRNTDTIRLYGYAGTRTGEVQDALTDEFILRLKVKKA
ncbi:hypothetical protein [uncultured Clostridium sp.]|uniref:hypothetical protein n=1 Tax=uncultured Clostridium sp. TaxID=59620 RepID=UPI00266EBCB5|nr:hypothetical protein [uncultured Clostridium sp.]